MRTGLTVALCGLAFAIAPATAGANGDPASHVLPVHDAFLPRSDEPSEELQGQLEALLQKTKESAFALRVAIIASPYDLGTVPFFFGKANYYAQYLAKEIERKQTRPLLVVMPSSLAVVPRAPATDKVLRRVALPKSPSGDDLTRTAIAATVALAKVAGHAVVVPRATKTSTRDDGVSPLLIFSPVILIAVAIAGLRLIDRLRASPDDASGPSAQ